jgi:hypothetical protein
LLIREKSVIDGILPSVFSLLDMRRKLPSRAANPKPRNNNKETRAKLMALHY